MPKHEIGIQAGNARYKFMELVTTANGVYMIGRRLKARGNGLTGEISRRRTG